MLVVGNTGWTIDLLAGIFTTQDAERLVCVAAVHFDQLIVFPVLIPAASGLHQQLLP